MPETTQFTGMGNESSGTSSLKSNSVISNRYKIHSIIGSGGMGTVYLARDLNFTDVKRLVAVKEMQTATKDAAMRGSMIKNFRREANLLAQLNHSAIPRIFDIFEINDRAYLVMEYINGTDLEQLMQKTKELPIEKVLEWAIDLCDVLDYLHNQTPDPIIFRDMKPSNVMIDSQGKVRLIDFGIARTFVHHVKGTMIGTEGYSAPEQYKGDANPQSDIYSLGATLHHVLTRKDPRLEAPFTFHERQITSLNANVRDDFAKVVEKALQSNQSERYATCVEMKRDLERIRMSLSGMVAVPQRTGTASAPQPGAAEATPSTGFFDTEATGAIQPKWVFKTEDEIRSSAAASKDIAYIGSYDTNLWAIKLEDGLLAWKFPTRGGIASSPVLDEQSRTVVFGSEDFSLYAVDGRTGRVSWTLQTKGRIRSTPRITHNVAFVGSDDCHVYAVNMTNGRQMWAYDMGAPVRTRPYVTNELIIAGCEAGEIVGITLSGGRKWSYRTRKAVLASPCVDDEGNCYIGSTDSFMYALDVNNGFNSWRFRTNGAIYSSPIENRGLLYFGSTDSNFYCVNAENGREKWRFNAEKPIVGSAVIHKGGLYFGSTDQNLYCLDSETGRERWHFSTGGPITSTPIIAGDLLLVGSMDHNLYALPLVS
ncbi:MAG: PQQ-binding-like beta-propeller repeat protein [Anaerolineae bacterium]|nr:PQQ-binding-like beta-propeller repeat protein [Anaerolineae bacterium]